MKVSDWKKLFAGVPSWESTTVGEVVERYMLTAGTRDRARELTNAMTAWAEMYPSDWQRYVERAKRTFPDYKSKVRKGEVPAFFRDGRDMQGNDV